MNVKFWCLCLCICGMLAACDNGDEVTYVTTDSYLNQNNITDVVYLHETDLSVDENTILYLGNRQNKDWFALFDKTSGELLQEWYGMERTIHVDGTLSYISPDDVRIVEWLDTNTIVFVIPRVSYIGNMLVLLHKDQGVEYGVYPEEENLVQVLDKDRYCYSNYDEYSRRIFNILDFKGNIIAENVVRDGNDDNFFYLGFQENKLWAGYYDSNGNYKESCSLEDFERDRTLHLGYGEYIDVHIDAVGIRSIRKNDYGYAFLPVYRSSSWDFVCDVLFLNEQDNLFYIVTLPFETSGGSYQIEDWYKDSVLLYKAYGGSSFVFNMKGEKLFEAKGVDETHEDLHLLSYEEGIYLDRTVSRYKFSSGTSVWHTALDKLSEVPSDARISFTIQEQNETSWTVLCNVVNRDGSKSEFTFRLDIGTGQVEYLEN